MQGSAGDPRAGAGGVGETLASAALGLLVGSLVGLSVSQVVGTLIGALTAILAAYFGLSELGSRSARHARITAFALATIGGLVMGIYTRTHDFFSERASDQVAEWKAAGYSSEVARDLVIYERTGLVLEAWTATPGIPPGSQSSVLFGTTAEECSDTNPELYSDSKELLKAFNLAGDEWDRFARATNTLTDEGERRKMLEAGWRLACP